VRELACGFCSTTATVTGHSGSSPVAPPPAAPPTAAAAAAAAAPLDGAGAPFGAALGGFTTCTVTEQFALGFLGA
jgi:hypothetical protein